MPTFTEYINRIVNSSDPLKFAYTGASYKPFVSLFNVTGVAQMNNTLAGVGEYLRALGITIGFHFPQWISPDRSHSKFVHRQRLGPLYGSTLKTAQAIYPTTPMESWVQPPEMSPFKPLSITYPHLV